MDVTAGQIWWAELSPTRGREQAGGRPLLVVPGERYHDLVETMTLVVPITSTDRSWPHHVPVSAGDVSGFAMTEQVRTIGRERLVSCTGDAGWTALESVRWWLAVHLSGEMEGWRG